MLLGQHCARLSTILLSAATPDWELIQANNIVYNQEHTMLPPTALLHPVFNNMLQFSAVLWP